MKVLVDYMYPFWAALIGGVTAQLMKPFIYYIRMHKWKPHLFMEAGGFPSSHTATVFALSLAVGIQENFNSTIFAVTLAISLITAYDAANVRYYAGENIRITHQLIRDIQELMALEFNDPIYGTKVKEVLGHKWFEVIAGGVWGLIVAALLWWFK